MKKLIKKMIPRSAGYWLRKIYLRARGILYYGNHYYCPICNHSYRKFFTGGFDLPVINQMQIIGAGRRESMVCPGCASTDRERLIYLLITNPENKFLPAKSILHIAPEPALSSWIRHNQKNDNLQYIEGVKYHEGFYYSPNIILMDILNISYPDNYFDLIICNHVLEHIEQDRTAMKELLRVLKPGGKAILQVPWSPILDKTIEDNTVITPSEREKYFGQFDHVRLYGNDYIERLKEAGFHVSVMDVKNLMKEVNYLNSIALNPKEVIFVGTKQVLE